MTTPTTDGNPFQKETWVGRLIRILLFFGLLIAGLGLAFWTRDGRWVLLAAFSIVAFCKIP